MIELSDATINLAFTATVMAHPTRKASAENLARELEGLAPRIAYDPHPTHAPSALRTAAVAWSQADPSMATHHLVIQDDARPCRRFIEHLRDVVAKMSDRPIYLFNEWGTQTAQVCRIAACTGSSFATPAEVVGPLAVVLPSKLALGFSQTLLKEDGSDLPDNNDSIVLDRYLRQQGARPLICIPNIVEHDSPYIPSIWPHKIRRGLRRSVCFSDDTGDENSFTSTETFTPSIIASLQFRDLESVTSRATSDQLNPQLATIDYLQGQGLRVEDLVTRFRSSVQADAHEDSELGEAILFECWLTGFLMGYTTEHTLRVDTPLARRALGTLLPGALRRLLSPQKLEYLHETSTRVAEAGIEQGIESAPRQSSNF